MHGYCCHCYKRIQGREIPWITIGLYESISLLFKLNCLSNIFIKLSKTLLKYVPQEAIPLIAEWLKKYRLHFTISKSRKSKLGDFRPAYQGKPNRISVNGDLNTYHFLVTLSHEVAHAAVWKKHGSRVLPHGVEWQNTFRTMLLEMMEEVHFPKELSDIIFQHLDRPKASSCSDPILYRALKKYDKDGHSTVFLEDIEHGFHFSLDGKRIFKKGKKRRSRYECICLNNKRMYYVSAHAEVQIMTEQ